MEELVKFGSGEYFVFLFILAFGRGMDFLSTWIATPNLVLEANPVARKLGWRGGACLNILVVILCAAWPLPALVIATSSMLVAARNFQSAWLMRSLGEENYRAWMVQCLGQTRLPLHLFCVAMQTGLTGLVGAALMVCSPEALVPFGIGMGVVTYAAAIAFFTLLSVWRIRR